EFTVSPFICYDLRFPEIFRAAVFQGAQLFVVIANWPASRVRHWITLLKARAIENQAYVMGVNRCGNDPKLSYSGHSMIIDPRGEVLADASEVEGVISAEIDAEALAQYRREFPFLNDIHHEYVKTKG
ncbi:MAG TPA: nitrilase-related carbon-nitrogen hydrolase, partial [Pyrinomonadaceae bacterium]|nr:nitrilase-related carbon-nitrogen hydrolase [Pyrinomonadaceae bacterium]